MILYSVLPECVCGTSVGRSSLSSVDINKLIVIILIFYSYSSVNGVVTSARNIADSFGEENHQLTVNELASHSHDVTYYSTSGGEAAPRIGQPPQAGSTYPTQNTGGDQPHNNIQPT